MEVHLNNPSFRAKIDQWVAETDAWQTKLVEEAMAGYFDEWRTYAGCSITAMSTSRAAR
jgi:hypothetical protein